MTRHHGSVHKVHLKDFEILPPSLRLYSTLYFDTTISIVSFKLVKLLLFEATELMVSPKLTLREKREILIVAIFSLVSLSLFTTIFER